MSKLPRRNLLIVGLVVAGLLVIGYVLFRYSQQQSREYSCIYEGGTQVRCLADYIGDEEDCYGYYEFRGDTIEEGINVTYPADFATCEGYIPGDQVFFDKHGNLVN